jgi:hypothetical protein
MLAVRPKVAVSGNSIWVDDSIRSYNSMAELADPRPPASGSKNDLKE